MRKAIPFSFIFSVVCGLAFLEGCKKETILRDPYEVFTKPYTTGIIQFSYKTPFVFNGKVVEKNTTLAFTSSGATPSEYDDYGYNKPSVPWAQVRRVNPQNFLNSAGVYFIGTDLNALPLPYTFEPGSAQYAQMEYVKGYVLKTDANGNQRYYGDGYAAQTYSDNFKLTILSRENNRLQGKFSGVLKHILYGDTIEIENGLFDIVIVQK